MNIQSHPITVKITDVDYFYMVENEIRNSMKKYEVGVMLREAQQVLSESGVSFSELVQYPVEGYYNESPCLKTYFTIIRNLQENEQIFDRINKKSKSLDFLWKVISSPIFGKLIISKNNPKTKEPVLPRMSDIVTETMSDKDLFNSESGNPWNSEDIILGMSRYFSLDKTTLVSLAFFTGDKKCLLGACESNSLYREIVYFTGCCLNMVEYEWRVSSLMQKMGEQLICDYNKLIGSSIEAPTIFNHLKFNKNPKYPRQIVLGKVLTTNQYYYWKVDKNNVFSEGYTDSLVTTEELQ